MVSCIRIGTPLLAKTAETVDVISGGRLEFGIGAGTRKMSISHTGLDFLNQADDSPFGRSLFGSNKAFVDTEKSKL